jgi:catalase (peroxidase I)
MVLVNASHQNRKWQQYRDVARAALEPVESKSPELSYADLYAFAGVVAVEESGGPKIEYCVGREDDTDGYKPDLKTNQSSRSKTGRPIS